MRASMIAVCAVAATLSACATAGARPGDVRTQPSAMGNAAPARATREDLYRVLDAYLAALEGHDPAAAPWAEQVVNTENNVALRVGDGLWNTITKLGDYDLRFADAETGQVGRYGSLYEEPGVERPFTLRLKVVDGAIAEVETLVHRREDSPMPFPAPIFPVKPAMNEVLPVEEQTPRLRMISIADGYFDTLQLNDGRLFTSFSPSCNRFENGFQTTNNPDQDVSASMTLSCEAQFRQGNFLYDDRLRARRYPLIDQERGLLLASAFIDHSGKPLNALRADGTPFVSGYKRPHSFYLLELFKIKDGAIEQVEANFITVPYSMPSPWAPEDLPPLP